MTADTPLDRAAIEASPRRTLQWGGGLLVVGLAAVGVGAADEGSALALGGLLLTIYGIHRYGRLGPDEPEPEAKAALDRAAAINAMWAGGLVVIAGLAVTLGSYLFTPGASGSSTRFLLAYGAILGGGARLFTGYTAWAAAQAKLAKAARAEKDRPSTPPEAAAEPRPKRRRRKRKAED
jgi:hypothetical protein